MKARGIGADERMDSRRAQAAEAAESPREDAARFTPSPAPHAAEAALSRARPRAAAPFRPHLASRPAGRGSGRSCGPTVPLRGTQKRKGRRTAMCSPAAGKKILAARYSPAADCRSTLAVGALHFRVRNGNGCCLPAMATRNKRLSEEIDCRSGNRSGNMVPKRS